MRRRLIEWWPTLQREYGMQPTQVGDYTPAEVLAAQVDWNTRQRELARVARQRR